ncbi:hypothetical protein [Pseudoponticoccus marisrubri]|uniref:Uncharacterized protein n=1 Tax=Pseudoponticoccus marisrubri TaxID=1685382 RepID=A0A0W7WN95_9RHOB|nr:hypothetical protein [Pseudoponticoccus marisrubri]KUF12038.1 hypothetical protein AVJ23_05540 [Pseudoponticoccus marisrubri]
MSLPTLPSESRPPVRRNGWHVSADAERLVLARHWPPRFDLAAMSAFPPVRRGRLARQVRQDLWRLLKGLRGFSPVIEIAAAEGGVRLQAGGRVDGAVPAGTADRIKALLDDPAHRARWIGWARERT